VNKLSWYRKKEKENKVIGLDGEEYIMREVKCNPTDMGLIWVYIGKQEGNK